MTQQPNYSHRPAMDAYVNERVIIALQAYWQAVNSAKPSTYEQLAKADQVARAEAIRAQADFFKLGLNNPEPLDYKGGDIDHEDYGR